MTQYVTLIFFFHLTFSSTLRTIDTLLICFCLKQYKGMEMNDIQNCIVQQEQQQEQQQQQFDQTATVVQNDDAQAQQRSLLLSDNNNEYLVCSLPRILSSYEKQLYKIDTLERNITDRVIRTRRRICSLLESSSSSQQPLFYPTTRSSHLRLFLSHSYHQQQKQIQQQSPPPPPPSIGLPQQSISFNSTYPIGSVPPNKNNNVGGGQQQQQLLQPTTNHPLLKKKILDPPAIWTLNVEGVLLVDHLDYQAVQEFDRKTGYLQPTMLDDPTTTTSSGSHSGERSSRTSGTGSGSENKEEEKDDVTKVIFTRLFDRITITFQTIFYQPSQFGSTTITTSSAASSIPIPNPNHLTTEMDTPTTTTTGVGNKRRGSGTSTPPLKKKRRTTTTTSNKKYNKHTIGTKDDDNYDDDHYTTKASTSTTTANKSDDPKITFHLSSKQTLTWTKDMMITPNHGPVVPQSSTSTSSSSNHIHTNTPTTTTPIISVPDTTTTTSTTSSTSHNLQWNDANVLCVQYEEPQPPPLSAAGSGDLTVYAVIANVELYRRRSYAATTTSTTTTTTSQSGSSTSVPTNASLSNISTMNQSSSSTTTIGSSDQQQQQQISGTGGGSARASSSSSSNTYRIVNTKLSAALFPHFGPETMDILSGTKRTFDNNIMMSTLFTDPNCHLVTLRPSELLNSVYIPMTVSMKEIIMTFYTYIRDRKLMVAIHSNDHDDQDNNNNFGTGVVDDTRDDHSLIQCDTLLNELFQVEQFHFSQLQNLLVSHHCIERVDESSSQYQPIYMTYIMKKDTAALTPIVPITTTTTSTIGSGIPISHQPPSNSVGNEVVQSDPKYPTNAKKSSATTGKKNAAGSNNNNSSTTTIVEPPSTLQVDVDCTVPSLFPYRARELLRRIKRREYEYTSTRTKGRYLLHATTGTTPNSAGGTVTTNTTATTTSTTTATSSSSISNIPPSSYSSSGGSGSTVNQDGHTSYIGSNNPQRIGEIIRQKIDTIVSQQSLDDEYIPIYLAMAKAAPAPPQSNTISTSSNIQGSSSSTVPVPTPIKRVPPSETKIAAHLDARLSYLLAQVNERQQNVLGYWNLIRHLLSSTNKQQQHNEGRDVVRNKR